MTESDHLKAGRDTAIRDLQAHKTITLVGFVCCVLGGFGFGLGAGYSMGSKSVREAPVKPTEVLVEEGLWERGTPIGSEPRVR